MVRATYWHNPSSSRNVYTLNALGDDLTESAYETILGVSSHPPAPSADIFGRSGLGRDEDRNTGIGRQQLGAWGYGDQS